MAADISSRRRMNRLQGLVLGALATFAFAGSAAPPGEGDGTYIVCPCRLESDGETLRLTAGVRSYWSKPNITLRFTVVASSGEEDVDSRAQPTETIATIELSSGVQSQELIAPQTYETSLAAGHEGRRHLYIHLDTPINETWRLLDRVSMESPADLDSAFDIRDLDYLRDTDGDGVGDANERLMDTDATDPTSTPPHDVEIDALAFYSKNWTILYDHDPFARIAHSFALTNAYLRDSGVQFQFRVVGAVETEKDNIFSLGARARDDANSHGSDMYAMFRIAAPSESRLCGIAYVNTFYQRGHMHASELRSYRQSPHWNLAQVLGRCSAKVLAHELGHVMGLAHSKWQNEKGTWRWSRGHAEAGDFNTIMSYTFGGSHRVGLFSNPNASCSGFARDAKPCGIDRELAAAADAVTSLNAVRYQFVRVRDSKPDTDGDGFVDAVDDLPDDPSEWRDTDGDGVGDRADEDDDGDGVPDAEDAFRLDATESSDADGDGIGDNADEDDDNDGFSDAEDAFPLDATEWTDSDGDGTGDNADAFPLDALETSDTDGDGVGDNADNDDDNDGVEDGDDAFPLDPNDWQDADGDGVGDNADIWPTNPDRSDLASYEFVGEKAGTYAHLVPGMWTGPAGDSAYVLLGEPRYDALRENVDSDTDEGAAYVIARSDLDHLDLADGLRDRVIHLANITHGRSSWRLIGEPDSSTGEALVSSGDMDGDGLADVLVGAPGFRLVPEYGISEERANGAVYFVSGADLPAADAADGISDRNVQLELVVQGSGSFRLTGESAGHYAGSSVVALPDRDGDGKSEILLGAPSSYPENEQDSPIHHEGAAYLLASSDIKAADVADGDADGRIMLRHVVARPNSYGFLRERQGDRAGAQLAMIGDSDGDGIPDILIGAGRLQPDEWRRLRDPGGAAYFLSGARLADLDAADGSTDGSIQLGLTAGSNTYRFASETAGFNITYFGSFVKALGDINADGRADFAIGSDYNNSRNSVLVSGAELPALDAADGVVDGRIEAANIAGLPESARLDVAGENLRPGYSSTRGEAPVLLELGARDGGSFCLAGEVYLYTASALARADVNAGGVVNRQALREDSDTYWMRGAAPYDRLGQYYGDAGTDFDGDGDTDILLTASRRWRLDGRDEWRPHSVYLLMAADFAALDASDGESNRRMHFANFAGDTDGDGLSNTLDKDDDGDGVLDVEDAFPLDAAEWSDYDGDCLGNSADPDDDNDGVMDARDAFPRDPLEFLDTDGDGAGDSADTDDDGDGIADTEDVFPLDASEWADSDGDGLGDNADAFPEDAAETSDADGDGLGDNTDPDDDNDGVPDASDLAPLDASRSDLLSYEFVGEQMASSLGVFNEVALTAGAWWGEGGEKALVLLSKSGFSGAGSEGVTHLIARSDFERLDRADGLRDRVIHLGNIAHGESSWRLVGEPESYSGTTVISRGDMDGDGVADALVNASNSLSYRSAGMIYFVSGADLPEADAADGEADRNVRLELVVQRGNSFKLIGEGPYQLAGQSLAVLPDQDGDGRPEILVGAPGLKDDRLEFVHYESAAYLLASGDIEAVDAADGETDGRIELRHVADGTNSYRFLRERKGDRAGSDLAVIGDAEGDGIADILIGANAPGVNRNTEGVVYLLSGARLRDLDAADGFIDGTIRLRLAAGSGAYRFAPESTASSNHAFGSYLRAVGDMNADGLADFMIGYGINKSVLVSGGALPAMDAADGAVDGHIEYAQIASISDSISLNIDGMDLRPAHGAAEIDSALLIELRGRHGDYVCNTGKAYLYSMKAVQRAALNADGTVNRQVLMDDSDTYRIRGAAHFDHLSSFSLDSQGLAHFDRDGVADVLVVASRFARRDGVEHWRPPSAYLLMGADLAALDRADGSADRRLHLANFAGDTDGDGLPNALDPDDDGDGIPDLEDVFQLDAAEWSDLDRDCIGNNRDTDDDNDYISDDLDAFPLDPYESADTDGDGIGNNADTDDDGDGVADEQDAFPLDPARSALRSFQFQAETAGDRLGHALAAIGDLDGDGTSEIALGAPRHSAGGAVYVLSLAETGASDLADESGDGVIPMAGIAAEHSSWKLVGEDGQEAGAAVFPVGDMDGDGTLEFGVAAGFGGLQSVYLISGANIAGADAADGATDGVVKLDLLMRQTGARRSVSGLRRAADEPLAAIGDADGDGRADVLLSEPAANDATGLAGLILGEPGAEARYDWQFSGEQAEDFAGRAYQAADFDGDGLPDLAVGAPGHDGAEPDTGAAYLIGSRDWQAVDAADGAADGHINLGRAAAEPHSWKLLGESAAAGLGRNLSLGDLDGNGQPDLVLLAGTTDGKSGATLFAVSGDANRLAELDASDGTSDGQALLRRTENRPGRWTFDLPAGERAQANTGDFDGDGRSDLLIGLHPEYYDDGVCAYLLAAADLFAESHTTSAMRLDGVIQYSRSYALRDCPSWGDTAPSLQAPADVDGDEHPDILLGIHDSLDGGEVYLISGADLAALDQLDGQRDRVLSLSRITRNPPSD